jgi:PAS domain S-box-containing protein
MSDHALPRELAELKVRLAEAEDALRAIRSGEVDVIAVNTSEGNRLFTLKGADQPYREMVEAMSEGAITATPGGVILYCNQRFADMTKAGLQTIIGSSLLAHCAADDTAKIIAALHDSDTDVPRIKVTLLASDATRVPVNVAMRSQRANGQHSIAIVVTDLTQWQRAEDERAIRALRMRNTCSSAVIHATTNAGCSLTFAR